MYNNKQDFVPPLVLSIVYLTNTEGAYGQLGYHSAAVIFRKGSPKIPFSRYFMLPICDGLQLHIPCMQHKDLLLYYQQSLVK